jgi:hypothetical protein
MIQLGGSIVQYSHRVWGTRETSYADKNVFKRKGRPARRADNLTAICEPIV